MRQLALKKKESRLLWQILMRGIVATDRINKKAVATELEDYQKLRQKLIDAWRSGIIVSGVRPKHKIYDIMPDQILQETELAELKKLSRQYKGKTNREIVVPKKKPAA
jgi:hypothetical protein